MNRPGILSGLALVGLVGAGAVLAFAPRPESDGGRLLFYEGRAAHPDGSGALVVDSAGQVLRVANGLVLERVTLHAGTRHLASVAPDGSGGTWAADGSGALLHFDSVGLLLEEASSRFSFPALAFDSRSRTVWIVRGTRQFDFEYDPGPSPIAVAIRQADGLSREVGQAVQPAHALLRTLANAGHLVAAGDTLFFAPFIRDEVVAFGPRGDTLWLTSRHLPQSTDEPKFEISGGQVVIDYHPVNLGLTRGPDGLLYLLSTAGFTMSASRLDVLDPETGEIRRTLELNTPHPTLATDGKGMVRVLDPAALTGALPPASRQPAPAFALPLLEGDTVRLSQLRGRVVVVNLWASWCTPCRREMPALDSLWRRIADTTFVLLAISEDVDRSKARHFLEQFGFTFPVAFGDGRLDRLFFYPGLPFTVLIDAGSRVVGSWIGELTEADIGRLELAIARELRATREDLHAGH